MSRELVVTCALPYANGPLHLGHLRLMVRAAEIGAIIFPPIPAFYGRPQTVAELRLTASAR